MSFAFRLLYPGIDPYERVHYEAFWTPEPIWMLWRMVNLLLLSGNRMVSPLFYNP